MNTDNVQDANSAIQAYCFGEVFCCSDSIKNQLFLQY